MKFQQKIVSLAAVYALVLIFSIVFQSCEANGKKCQQYGHSCLGGHGKRSDELVQGVMQQNSEMQRINDPLLNRMSNLLRLMIAQRVDAYRHSAQMEAEAQNRAEELEAIKK